MSYCQSHKVMDEVSESRARLNRKQQSRVNWINDKWACCPAFEPASLLAERSPGLSRPVETTSSTLEPLRLAFMMRSSVTSDQNTSSRLWWKSRAMAFSRLLSSRVYSERCGKTWRMSMRLANSSTGSGPEKEDAKTERGDGGWRELKWRKKNSEKPNVKWKLDSKKSGKRQKKVWSHGHF